DDQVHVRTPPRGLADTTDDVASRMVSFARGLTDGTDTVGVAFPAIKEARIDASALERADGWAVCVAGRAPSGVQSMCLYRPLEGTGWQEAYAGLDWLCERLSLLVIEAGLTLSAPTGRDVDTGLIENCDEPAAKRSGEGLRAYLPQLT